MKVYIKFEDNRMTYIKDITKIKISKDNNYLIFDTYSPICKYYKQRRIKKKEIKIIKIIEI